MINTHKQAGLTLIEMMIAMLLGLFVSAVTITIFSTNVRSNVENMKMIRLNQELRGAMTFIVDELKRAGYSKEPTVSAFIDELSFTSTCARYSYDEDNNALLGDTTPDADERFGFKLSDNTISWSQNTTTTDCSNGTWTPITDPNLAKITTLTFDFSKSVNSEDPPPPALPPSDAFSTTTGVSIYEVTITLIGSTDLPFSSDADDPRRTITETIRVRNDAPKS